MKRKFCYSDIDYLIGEYVIGRNGLRDREILRLHFLDGLTNEAIAEAVKMSPTQIQRIVKKKGDMILLMIEK